MSDNHIKEPGSLPDLPSPQKERDSTKSQTKSASVSESGWRNYPEEFDMQKDPNQKPADNQTEAILQQLIADNTGTDKKQISPKPIKTQVLTETSETDRLSDLIEQVNNQHKDQTQTSLLPQTAVGERLQKSIEPLDVKSTQLDNNAKEQTPIANTSENDQIHAEALERWLEKPVAAKEPSSISLAALYSSISLVVVLLAYTGVYITGNYKSFGGPLAHLGVLFIGNNTDVANARKETERFNAETAALSNVTTKPKQAAANTTDIINFPSPKTIKSSSILNNGSGSNTSSNSSFNTNGSGNAGAENSTKIAATSSLLGTSTLKSNTQDCPIPETQLTSAPGGYTVIKMQSECRSGQSVTLSYAGIRFKSNFDQQGSFSYIIDAFVGDRQPITISYNDGKQQVKTPVLEDMAQITKITLIWDNQHDLNLHALEYAATPGSKNHVWQKNPLSFENVSQKLQANTTGHGFMSSTNGISSDKNKRVEVYTFVHSPDEVEQFGVIKLAIGYVVKQSSIQKVACSAEEVSYVNYKAIQLKQNGSMDTQQGQLAINPCNISTTNKLLIKKAIKDLTIGENR